eukprot:TRINITY_DN10801_c0_g2_i3.p1 TRINITY_DN10801_c0_g2~~TRINITY_DN10801_c0_g2_i3.p1  ORF type:complete len:204 (+),score=6.14 TRINITY_DN10801_c0_g2_i3:46-657(+)
MNKKAHFTCPYPECARAFKTKYSMKRHLFIHTQDKRFLCPHCPKAFALPQYLKEHIFTHTKDRPYVCDVAGCNKKFRQAGKLLIHRRTHKEHALKTLISRCAHKKTSVTNEGKPSIKVADSRVLDRLKDESNNDHRGFARQSSGHTTATLNECNVDCFKNEVDMYDNDRKQKPASEGYLHYLSFIDTPLGGLLRPILPLPLNK